MSSDSKTAILQSKFNWGE